MVDPAPVLALANRSDRAVCDTELFRKSHVRQRISLAPFRFGVWLRKQLFDLPHFSLGEFFRPSYGSVVTGNMKTLRRKDIQVLRSIVVTPLIFVMDDLSWRQRTAQHFLGDKQATSHVVADSPRMVRGEHVHVAFMSYASTVPAIRFCALALQSRMVMGDKFIPSACLSESLDWLAAAARAVRARPNRTPFRHTQFYHEVLC